MIKLKSCYGETGEKPVRARRRNTEWFFLVLYAADTKRQVTE